LADGRKKPCEGGEPKTALTEQKITKEAIAVALKADVPTLLWGSPGVGKSRFIEKLGRELGFEVFTIIGSTLDPTDIRGLPYRTEHGTQFERPYFLKVAAEKPSLIFLDELTAAPPAIWAALLRLILDKAIDDFKLHPQSRVLGAGNPPEMTGLGFELSLPMANRFVHLEFKAPAPKAIGNYFRFGDFEEDKQIIERVKAIWNADMTPYLRKWGSVIATFLERVNLSLIHQLPREGMEFPDCYAFPTPRSWEFVVKLMAAADLYMGIPPTKHEITELHSTLLVGCVGSGATTPLVDWLDNLDMPDPMAVLQGKAPLPSREDTQLLLISNIAQIYRDAAQKKDTKIFTLVANFALKLNELKRRDLVLMLLSYMHEASEQTGTWHLFQFALPNANLPNFVPPQFRELLHEISNTLIKWNKQG
jgi:MoxR-like ATPase